MCWVTTLIASTCKGFLFYNCPFKLWALPFPVQWVLEVKRPGREAEHSPPSDSEVKNSWICTSSPTYMCIVRGQFCLIRGQIQTRFEEVCRKNKITNHFLPKMVPYSVMVLSVQLYRPETVQYDGLCTLCLQIDTRCHGCVGSNHASYSGGPSLRS